MIHILALSAQTPVGVNAEQAAASVRAGISRIGEHPHFVDRQGDKVLGALVPWIDARLDGWRRLLSLCIAGLHELASKLPARALAGEIPALLALPEPRPGFQEEDARRVATELESAARARGWNVRVTAAGRGHAGGLGALKDASEWMQRGGGAACIVGGADSYFHKSTLEWLQENRQLMGSETRGGFPPGEAASFVFLATDSGKRSLRGASLAVLRGCGVSHEANLIKADDVNLGVGLAAAITGATRPLQLPREAADSVYCDLNGERYRSEEWGLALLRDASMVRDTTCTTAVGSWGDVGAASGPLLCMLAARAWARGYAKGPRALLWAGSEGGARAAAVLQAPEG